MLALVGPILSKVKLSGAHLGPRLGQVGPMWSMLGTSWAHVEPMLGLCWPMLGLCWPRLGLCWAYVEPSWRLCWAYVGDMMAILGLCWGYVRKCKSSGGPLPTKCRLSLSARPALPTPPWKNTAFLHFSLFPASYFDMRNKPCKTQCFLYLTHTIHCKLQGLQ